MTTDTPLPDKSTAGWRRRDVHAGIDWKHDRTGAVVQLRRVGHAPEREMTPRTANNPEREYAYDVYVRPAEGAPAVEYERLPATYDREHAIAEIREILAEYPHGRVDSG